MCILLWCTGFLLAKVIRSSAWILMSRWVPIQKHLAFNPKRGGGFCCLFRFLINHGSVTVLQPSLVVMEETPRLGSTFCESSVSWITLLSLQTWVVLGCATWVCLEQIHQCSGDGEGSLQHSPALALFRAVQMDVVMVSLVVFHQKFSLACAVEGYSCKRSLLSGHHQLQVVQKDAAVLPCKWSLRFRTGNSGFG